MAHSIACPSRLGGGMPSYYGLNQLASQRRRRESLRALRAGAASWFRWAHQYIGSEDSWTWRTWLCLTHGNRSKRQTRVRGSGNHLPGGRMVELRHRYLKLHQGGRGAEKASLIHWLQHARLYTAHTLSQPKPVERVFMLPLLRCCTFCIVVVSCESGRVLLIPGTGSHTLFSLYIHGFCRDMSP
ncbi:hypothetical protein LZ32DRAFT_105508 [Colletotrichum eremochloae]|nr:hypothetical protein LZ32DRAFT_105508 [Colletotrichum eremochloae]